MKDFTVARDLIQQAIAARAFPALVVEVGTASELVWREAFGQLTWDPESRAADEETIFDLASLTKVIATASVAMRLVDAQKLALDDRVARWQPNWTGADREEVTVRDLLAHSAGLTAWLPLYRDHENRGEFEKTICTLPLEYAPRTQALYSDLGFMLLGFILQDAGGQTLADAFEEIRVEALGGSRLIFNPPAAWRSNIAPTEVDAWRGRLLVGEVHDENAWALGGAAPHAGLFGTAGAVGAFARTVLETRLRKTQLAQPETMRLFSTKTEIPGSSRALAWDTMRPTSSCGTRMSPTAFGHTGFTGTSLWIDPDANIYVVVLANRVHPKRENNAIVRLRPAIHDAIMSELAASR